MSTAAAVSPDRAAWLADRRKGVGASEVAAIMGVSPYEGPLSVYCRKLGIAPEPEETLPMKIGTLMEPVIARLYADHTGREIVRQQVVAVCPERPHLRATVDGVTGRGTLVEFKTIGEMAARANGLGTEGDDVPESWLCQVHAQMLATGIREAEVACLVGGRDFRVFPIAFNEGLAGHLGARVDRFWFDHVLKRVPPPPMSGVDAEMIPYLYPERAGAIGLDGMALVAANNYVNLGGEIAERQKRRDDYRSKLLYALGPFEAGTLPDGRLVTAKSVEVKAHEVKASKYTRITIKAPKEIR